MLRARARARFVGNALTAVAACSPACFAVFLCSRNFAILLYVLLLKTLQAVIHFTRIRLSRSVKFYGSNLYTSIHVEHVYLLVCRDYVFTFLSHSNFLLAFCSSCGLFIVMYHLNDDVHRVRKERIQQSPRT